MTTKIEKIVLNIGRKTVELSVDEAKELKKVLSEIFGADKVEYITKEVHHDHYPYRWYPTYWLGSTAGTSITLSAANTGTTTTTDPSDWLAQMKSQISF